MKKFLRSLFSLLLTAALCAGISACGKNDGNGLLPVETETEEQIKEKNTRKWVNLFAANMMDLYYLWTKEIADAIKAWKLTEEPISYLKDHRYKDDRWSKITDDFASFYGSVSGTQKTYGYDLTFGYADAQRTTICAVITFTYAGSPARNAGLKRGDIILEVNGKTMTPSNYADIVSKELLGGDQVKLSVYTGVPPSVKEVTLQSVEMYENPVHTVKVIDCGTKKVGYLHFTSFTLDACQDLIDACKTFRAAGISDLILDLRYNGGGFSLTEQVLASLLAPEAEVDAGSVLSTEVYNEALTKYYAEKQQDTKTYFKKAYDFKSSEGKSYHLDLKDANPRISQLVAIISSGTASASEAILCDLFPYLTIKLVGEQTHGKFCSGLMLYGPDFYDDNKSWVEQNMGVGSAAQGKKYADNWGLYVMYSRFADKDGVTRCMPDGLKPDVKVSDDVTDGYELGDPGETMLAKALELCGYQQPLASPAARPQSTASRFTPFSLALTRELQELQPGFGCRITLPDQLP